MKHGDERVAETIPAAQRTSAAAPARADRLRLTLVTGGILLALTVAVVLLRLQRLGELPPGVDAGEGINGIDALRVLQGEHAVFFSSHAAKFGGREGLVMYAIALAVSLFGRNEFALRLPTALASAGTVFVVFWLGQLLFGRDGESGRPAPWRGLMIGGVASGLMAVSLGLTIMGRTAYRTSWLPLFLCLCLALLWHGWRRRQRGGGWWWIVLAGVCAGLLPYTYIPARFVPLLFITFGLSFLLPFGRSGAGGEASGNTRPFPLRSELPWIGVFVAVAALVSAPILVHFLLLPDDFVSRSNHVLVFLPKVSQGNPLKTFLVNVWEHLLAFGFRGDPVWRHNFAERPLLNPWQALLFWLGVGMAAWRWQRRPAYRLLLLWLCTLTLPAMLSRDSVPNTLRMIGAAPAVYLLIAVGMWELFQFLEARFLRLRSGEAAAAAGAAVGALILFQGVLTYRAYFHDWAAAPETYAAYQTHWSELARTLNAQPPAADNVYLIPVYEWDSSYSWRYSFHYLYRGPAQTPMLYTVPLDLVSKVESTLARTENLSTARVVDWDDELVGGAPVADEQIAYLLGKYGRYQGSLEGPSFHIDAYADISLDRPWTFYDDLEPLAVHFDGGISLYGLALGQGTKQLPSRQPFLLDHGQATWVAMQWQSAPGLEVEYSISLRLHNDEGAVVYQQDAVLRDPNSASTKNWSAGEKVDTLHYLDLPADLAPGTYEMRMVVYDFATLKPTVEIGVWEPETALARLRLKEMQ